MIHIEENDELCSLEHVKQVVLQINGVSECDTNHVVHALTIEYDPDRVTLTQILRAIELANRSLKR
jgi:phosphoheptose isomerase